MQLFYSDVLMTEGGLEALGVLDDAELASRLRIGTDANGRPAEWIGGDARTISDMRASGLDAVNELLRAFEVPVVFITAYPERFLTGERPEPAFLISKPFQPAMVSAVASQALFFQRNSRNRAPRAASA